MAPILPIEKNSRQEKFSLIGARFGKLEVISLFSKGKNSKWVCKCDCGNEKIVARPCLGKTTNSCGCLSSELHKKLFTTHGMTDSNAYRSWTDMKTRCTNKKRPEYKNYGARGIKISSSWIRFENFYKDMGNPEDGMSLERIDNEKGYSKENCKWIPKKEQPKNRRTNILVFDGEEKITAKESHRRSGGGYCYSWHLELIKRGENGTKSS